MKDLSRFPNILLCLLGAVVAVFSFQFFVMPIVDPDFFWHLKTGEWIWQHRSLPADDPFSYTTAGIQSGRKHFILTAYWPVQVLYFLSYSAGGFPGIVLLRPFIVGLIAFTLLKRRKGDLLLYAGLVSIFLLAFLGIYPVDRPQVFSFLFFSCLLLLLKGIVEDRIRGKAYVLVPLLMLAWANTHTGYILGIATLTAYICTEGIKFIHSSMNPIPKTAYRRLVLAGLLGVVFSLFNPNGYHGIREILTPQPDALFNTEYLSAIEAMRVFNDYKFLLYFFLLALASLALLVSLKEKRFDLTDAALLAATGYFSFSSIRYIAVFMIAALPVIGESISKGRLLKIGRGVILAVALSSGLVLAWQGRHDLRYLASGSWIGEFGFPVEAAGFVAESRLEGNMYNHLAWGGYLVWRLAPERKVFIDGRLLSHDVYRLSRSVDNADRSEFMGMPLWKAIFRSFDVRYVVTPFYWSYGEAIPLVFELWRDGDWIPVFRDYHSVVFVKNVPEAYEVIKKYALPKESFIDGLVEECDMMIAANPENLFAMLVKGDLYLNTSRNREAREMYEMVLRIAPLNQTARERLDSIAQRSGN